MLSKRKNSKVEVPAQIIVKLLNKQEIRWNERQIKKAERIKLKFKKESKEKDYIEKL